MPAEPQPHRARLGPLPLIEVFVFAVVLAADLPVNDLIPLIARASGSLWARGLSWGDVGLRGRPPLRQADDVDAAIGPGILIGTGLALGAATMLIDAWAFGPGLQALTGRAVGLSDMPPAGGHLGLTISALLLAWAGAFAIEMIFRGYLLSRLDDLFGSGDLSGRVGLSVLAGAALYAWFLADGSLGGAMGGFAFGVGYGLLYLAGRRSLLTPIAFHGALGSTSLLLMYWRVI